MTRPLRPLSLPVEDTQVSALLSLPEHAWALCVLAHGAGAPMTHPFMEAIAGRLVARGLGTLRYQFPYMEAGRRAPDRPPRLMATVRAAIAGAAAQAPGLPLLAGGKSMGGRMTSLALTETGEPAVKGLVFLGFPLHPPNKPGTQRAVHLRELSLPMLFVQGSRDKLAPLPRLGPVIDQLPKATLEVVEGGDHSFKVLKRSGRTDEEALDQIAAAVEAWGRAVVGA